MIKFRAWHHKHEVMYPVRAIDLALEITGEVWG